MKGWWRGGGTFGGDTGAKKSRELKQADVPAIKWQNAPINPIITKLCPTKAANAFLSFPVVTE